MKSRSWVVLTLGFGALVALIGLLGVGTMRRAAAIHRETAAAHETYLQTEALLREIPADLHLAGILVRDYLLDPSHLTAPLYRRQLLDLRASLRGRLDLLAQRASGDEAAIVLRLRTEVRAYWDSFDEVFEWTPQQKTALSYWFLGRKVLPRRDAVLALADEVGKLNAANLERERKRVQASQERLQTFVRGMLLVALALGAVVALASIRRVSVLERRSERQRQQIEHAEQELRRLSHSLVQVQEEERKSLSRELHDTAGQMLTAMGMELASLDSLRTSSPEKFREHLDETRRLSAETLRLVRDLATGLRPSLLDDLGLGPALEWQAREFSRRSGVPVTVQIDGSLDGLPEAHRTCIYRVAQEALTNSARHAKAKNIRVSVHGRGDRVHLTVQDDGVGFAPASSLRGGLGLLGIEERVRELEGEVSIVSQPHKGTMLKVEVPIPGGVSA